MKKYIQTLAILCAAFLLAGCATKMIPAEDILVYDYCKEEIAVLKNPNLPANSKEKYEAALAISKKIDFGYTRTLDFLSKIFCEKDAKVDNPAKEDQLIVIYYPYKDKFVSFEFRRFRNSIYKTEVRYK